MNTTRILTYLLGNGRKRALVAAALGLSMAGIASGATIGLKLGINGNGGLQSAATGALLPGDSAGAPEYAQANWNVLGRWGDISGVVDSTGAASGVIVHWDATGMWSQNGGGTPTAQGTPDGNLMNAYVDSNGGAQVALTNGTTVYAQNGGNKPMVYIGGLSAWLAAQGASYYDVVVYADGDATSSRTGEYWLIEASGSPTSITFGGDLTTHAFICDQANFVSTATFTQVPLISADGAEAWAGYHPGNYVVFDSMTADSFAVRADEVRFPGGTLRSPINAIQIVPRTTPQSASIAPVTSCQTITGGTARFRAVVGGRAPLGYQWLKNGALLNDGGNVTGANTTDLVVTGVSGADVANYSLVVTNAFGAVTSAPAALSLFAPTAGSYAQKVVDNGPYAYWRLNDLSDPTTNGPARDVVGGFNGSYGQVAQNSSQGVVGPQPAAFPGFEASNAALQSANNTPGSFVTCPPLKLTNNMVTITAWVYPTAYSEPAYTGIVLSRNGGDTAGLCYGNAANYLGYNWNNQAVAYNFQSGLLVPSNIWSFVAVVVTPTNAILYMNNANGQFSATNAPLTNAVAGFSGPTMIGADPNAFGRVFSGSIDEAAVFNRALSPTEIAGLYKKGLGLEVIKAVISKSPSSLALMEGRPAKFSVVASGDAPLSYKWRRNSVELSDTGTISGTKTPTLSISAVTMADVGSYDVVVNNIAAVPATSAAATLSVVASNSAPTAYEAALRAANPIAYWRLNEPDSSPEAYDYWGGNIATHASVITGVEGPRSPEFLGMETTNAAASYDGFSGATATSTSLLNNRSQFSVVGWFNSPAQVQSLRAGLFGQNDVCEFGFHGDVASQSVGVWTPSAGAYLPVSSITPGQWYLIAAVGDGSKVNLYLVSTNNGGTIMQATGTGSTTNYGSSTDPFRIGGGGILDTTGNFFTGSIDEVAVFDRALTADELSGLLGAALVGGELAPTISQQPATNITLYAGRTFALTTEVVGKNLHFQWRKAGVPMSDSGNVSGTGTKNLTITNVTAANAGDYDLVVTNTAGAVTSVLATLNVIQPAPGGFEATVIAGNPLAYYRFGELDDPSTGTAVAHDYVGGFNGTYGIAAQNGYTGIAGPRPPSWLFETTNTALQSTVATADSWVSASFGTLGTNTVTFTMWINPADLQEAWSGLLMSRGGTRSGGLGYNDEQMLAYTWNSDTTWSWDSGLVPQTNQWSFVALVVEPTQATVYLGDGNGLRSAVNAVAHTSDVFGSWQIGHDNSGGNAARTYNGAIDEVAVYMRSLTSTEIAELFVAGGGVAPVTSVTLTIQKVNDNVVLSWPSGTLLEASDVTGTWTTNSAASPLTITPADTRKFYRVIQK